MWIAFAFGSALFAGITSILAKCGIRKTDSYLATAIRTIVVLIFSWMMVGMAGSFQTVSQITGKTLLFLILSGLATGASWICYFKALQLGDVNKVVPVDKSSTVLTMILAFLFLREPLTGSKIAGIIGIGLGTYLMIEKKAEKKSEAAMERSLSIEVLRKGEFSWLLFAVLSAVFASLTSILGKVGISGVESNLGTAIRTGVVLIMAWLVAGMTGSVKKIKDIEKKELLFICLSGVATGGSWLCYYRALQKGPASVVVPIDKLSILVTVAFSYVVLKERLTLKSAVGLLLIVAATLIMII